MTIPINLADLIAALSPTAYWKHAEGTGTTVVDSSGNGYNGTYSGDKTLTDAGIGDGLTCVNFGTTGAANVFSAGLAAAFNGATFTVFGCAKRPSWGAVSDRLCIFRVDADNYFLISPGGSANRLEALYKSGGASRSWSSTMTTTDWFTWALVVDSAQDIAKYYLNGILQDTGKQLLGAWAGALTAAYYSQVCWTNSNMAHNAYWAGTALTDAQIYNLSTGATLATATQPFALVSARTLISKSGATEDWNGRPALTKNLDGSVWVMGYRSASAHGTAGAGIVNLRLSDDEGATWTADNTDLDGNAMTGAPFSWHAGDNNTDIGNLVFMTAPNGDFLLHIWEDDGGGTYQYRSTNDGKTWTAEGMINNDDRYMLVGDWFVDGSTLYVAGEVCPYNNAPGDIWDRPKDFGLLKSTDNGVTWTLSYINVATSNDNSEPGICHTGTADRLVVTMRDGSSSSVYTGKTYGYTSSDMGITWSAQQTLDASLGEIHRPRLRAIGDNNIIMLGRENLSAPPAGGSYSNTGGYTALWLSADQGASWGAKYRLDFVYTEDCSYADFIQRANGDWYVLSYNGIQSGPASITEFVVRAVLPCDTSLTVPAQSLSLTVPAQSLALTVPAQSLTLTVPA